MMLKPGKAQQGRSMVEMVATMAIMALLGVVSISWFKGALAKQEAERDYEDIISTISALNNRGTARTDKGIADTFLTYNKTRSGKNLFILKACPTNTEAVTIKIDNIDERTCEYLMKKDWNKPYRPLFILRGENSANVYSWNGGDGPDLYRLTNVDDCTRTGVPEKGAFAVVFNDKRDSVVSCTEDTECGECEYCSAKGICESLCTEGQTCVENYNNSETKMCCDPENLVDGMCCRFPDGNGGCNECAQNSDCTADPAKPYCNTNTGKCQMCEGGYFKHANGTCRICQSSNVSYIYNVQRDECLACPAAFIEASDLDKETVTCKYCPGTVSTDRTSCDFNCPEGEYGTYKNATCKACTEENDHTYAHECRKCAGIRFWAPRWSQCQLCSVSSNPTNVLRSDCLTCPQRYMRGTAETGNCSLCSGFVSGDGTSCYTCDKAEPVETTEARCNQCAGQRYYNNSVCSLCPDPTNTTAWSALTLAQREQCVTKVEYLESTGTQYIDTGIIPTKNLSFDATFENPNSPCSNASGCGNVFGTRKGPGNNEYQLTLYGGSIGVGTRTSGLKFYANVMNHISFDGDKTVDINGTKKTIEVSDINDVGTIVLFAIRNLSSVVQYQEGKIYSVKFGNVRDFIPVLDPNGVPAMYDKVEKKLYYNAGTGDFIAGPQVN